MDERAGLSPLLSARIMQAYLGESGGEALPPATIRAISNGHIHGSWRIDMPQGTYFLQRINTEVFQDPDAVMRNLARIQDHLDRRKRSGPHALSHAPSIPVLIRTRSGDTHLHLDGAVWRLFEFIEGGVAHVLPGSSGMVRETGRAFAGFVRSLEDLDPQRLEVTIPSFHSLSARHAQLREAAANASQRQTEAHSADVDDLLRQADRLVARLLPLEQAALAGEIPMRITHNDAKLNNLLFHADGSAGFVVDLDTVMPGIVHYDVGDALRTLLPDRAEDDPDTAGMTIRLGFHRDFIEGYSEGDWLTPEEVKWLPYAAPYMACIMGVRFLADHMAGDRYFKTAYPGHNLTRAVNQLTLADKLHQSFCATQ